MLTVLSRRTLLICAFLSAMAPTGPAHAQSTPGMEGMQGMAPAASDTQATQEFKSGMAKMHAGMGPLHRRYRP